jgi:hypothetical protein
MNRTVPQPLAWFRIEAFQSGSPLKAPHAASFKVPGLRVAARHSGLRSGVA